MDEQWKIEFYKTATDKKEIKIALDRLLDYKSRTQN